MNLITYNELNMSMILLIKYTTSYLRQITVVKRTFSLFFSRTCKSNS